MSKVSNTAKYEINKEMVFSSTHVPETTAKALDHNSLPFAVTTNDYSWRIHVAQSSAVHGTDNHSELRVIAKIAKDHGCIWLVIDQDGPTYGNLPTFEW